jgi:hypothetical protein
MIIVVVVAIVVAIVSSRRLVLGVLGVLGWCQVVVHCQEAINSRV